MNCVNISGTNFDYCNSKIIRLIRINCTSKIINITMFTYIKLYKVLLVTGILCTFVDEGTLLTISLENINVL